MPRRRAVLAAGSTAFLVALSGCSALGDSEGSPATVESSRDLRPGSADVVARTAAERIGCPGGDVELRAVAYALPNGGLQVLTEVTVFPGRQECESNWVHDGVSVTHDWSELGPELQPTVTDTSSNVVFTDAGGDVSLANASNVEAGRWRVHRVAGGGDTAQYAFRSTCRLQDGMGLDNGPPSAGDGLAAVAVEVPLSAGGPLGGKSKTVRRSRTLVHGRGD